MSVSYAVHCDGPDCTTHVGPGLAYRYPETAWLILRPSSTNRGQYIEGELDFCSWECVMKFAAKQPIPTTITFGDDGEMIES